MTGCTLRQIQYWREKGIVVPIISDTGMGRGIWWSWQLWYVCCVRVLVLILLVLFSNN
ncbi:MerR family transcriptional regulator [Umezakia ovalisporum]|uniref:MerR family transcriptional regulator n=1 Tax=Umezakia ovalisporum TaxID=75695 RepID=UPI0036F426BD